MYSSILVFIQFIQLCTLTNYCDLCQGNHTMCLYKGPSTKCVNPDTSFMTAEGKKEIVLIHNQLRDKMAMGSAVGKGNKSLPSAANMMELEWDDELAMIAQRWVDQCLPYEEPKQHDMCRIVERFPVGQNINTIFESGFAASLITEFEEFIIMWYNEVKDYDHDEIKQFGSLQGKETVNHFTLMMKANLQYVGCGMVKFDYLMSTWHTSLPNKTGSIDGVLQRLVCNYGPNVNSVDVPLYSVGKPCSNCPLGSICSSKYSGLCENCISPILLQMPLQHFCMVRLDSEIIFVNGTRCKKRYDPTPKPSLITKQRLIGIWKDGTCRCNMNIRSLGSLITRSPILLLLNILSLICIESYVVPPISNATDSQTTVPTIPNDIDTAATETDTPSSPRVQLQPYLDITIYHDGDICYCDLD